MPIPGSREKITNYLFYRFSAKIANQDAVTTKPGVN